MKSLFVLIVALLLNGCAAYSGRGLQPQQSTLAEVLQVMGPPAMRWDHPDGSAQLAYPRGPAGVHTFMVSIGADGRLQSIRNVLDNAGFAQIKPGMSKDQVLAVLGPSIPQWTVYFERRDELVWEWRFCDDWNYTSRFDVLFDGTREVVRSTLTMTESQMGVCDRKGSCTCGH